MCAAATEWICVVCFYSIDSVSARRHDETKEGPVVSKAMAVLFATVVVAAVLVSRTDDAKAACFSDEQSIFVGNYFVDTAYGTSNTFTVHNRPLDTGCSNPAVTTTAQLGDPNAGNQVEIGYTEHLNGDGTHNFHWFWEAQHGTIAYNNLGDAGTGISTGTTDSWRVAFHSSDGNFHWYIDSGSGFTDVNPPGIGWGAIGFKQGNAKGEVSRAGGTNTDVDDHQWGLQRRQGSTGSNWVDWTGNTLPENQDGIPWWDHNKISDVEYKIVQCTGHYSDGKPC